MSHVTDLDDLAGVLEGGIREMLAEHGKALLERLAEDVEAQQDTDDADSETYADENVADEDYTPDEARTLATDAHRDGWSKGFDRAVEILREQIESASYAGWTLSAPTPAPAVSPDAAVPTA